MDFRPAYKALADRFEADLVSSGVLRKVSRQNLPARAFPEQPALIVYEHSVSPVNDSGIPGAYNLEAILILHTQTNATDEAPLESLMEVVSAIQGALRWRPGEPQSEGDGYWTTLGGAVRFARLGDVQITEDPERVSQTSTVMFVSMQVGLSD